MEVKEEHLIQLSYFIQEDNLNHLSSRDSTFIIGPFDDQINVSLNDTTNVDLNQSVAALSWRYQANSKLFLKTTFSLNQQDDQTLTSTFGRGQQNLSSTIFRLASRNMYRSKIEQTEARIDIDYYHNQKHHLRFGSQVDLRKLSPGNIVQNQFLRSSSLIQPREMMDSIFDENTEIRIYVEDIIQLNKFNIEIGISLGGFSTEEKYYFSSEPRIGINYLLSEKSKLSGFFSMNKQYFHYISYRDIQAPTDLLISSNFNDPPESAIQQNINYTQRFGSHTEVEIRVFNKNLKSLSRWSDNEFSESNSGYINNSNWNRFISYYDQSVQGADVNLTLITKVFQSNFRLSAMNIKESMESGLEVDSPQEMTYLFSSGLNVCLTSKLNLGLNWTYKNGLTTGGLYADNRETILSFYNSETAKNAVEQIADYHRLDASLTYTLDKRNARHELSLNVFNVYNQRNQVYYYKDSNPASENNTVVHGQPFFPSVGYQYTWRNIN